MQTRQRRAWTIAGLGLLVVALAGLRGTTGTDAGAVAAAAAADAQAATVLAGLRARQESDTGWWAYSVTETRHRRPPPEELLGPSRPLGAGAWSQLGDRLEYAWLAGERWRLDSIDESAHSGCRSDYDDGRGPATYWARRGRPKHDLNPPFRDGLFGVLGVGPLEPASDRVARMRELSVRYVGTETVGGRECQVIEGSRAHAGGAGAENTWTERLWVAPDLGMLVVKSVVDAVSSAPNRSTNHRTVIVADAFVQVAPDLWLPAAVRQISFVTQNDTPQTWRHWQRTILLDAADPAQPAEAPGVPIDQRALDADRGPLQSTLVMQAAEAVRTREGQLPSERLMSEEPLGPAYLETIAPYTLAEGFAARVMP